MGFSWIALLMQVFFGILLMSMGAVMFFLPDHDSAWWIFWPCPFVIGGTMIFLAWTNTAKTETNSGSYRFWARLAVFSTVMLALEISLIVWQDIDYIVSIFPTAVLILIALFQLEYGAQIRPLINPKLPSKKD